MIQQNKEIEEKKQRLKKIIDEKNEEIAQTKQKIRDLALIEEKSKTQIDQHIEMLTWLIDSIDNTVMELKNKMVTNSENAIQENSQAFLNYVQDIQEIMDPLKNAKQINDANEMRETIVSIAETLKMFSDNVDDSIESMASGVQNANRTSVEASTQEFNSFIEDIYQIFDTFNNVLQKIKLTNSIKKYLELEDIYIEINKIVDQFKELYKTAAEIQGKRIIKEEDLKLLTTYGLNKDILTLNKLRTIVTKKLEEVVQNSKKIDSELQELTDKFELVVNEKETIRNWFQALTEEVVERQNEAAETYAVLYSTLDDIHSTIDIIKSDFRNSSELAINSVIQEFTKKAKNFGRMVAIIKKLEVVEDVQKNQRALELIYDKSKSSLQEIRATAIEIAKNVRASNMQAIEQSFKDFDKFVLTFKEKFYIIQETVSSITLSTSESLISDLQRYTEDQIRLRLELMEKAAMAQIFELQRISLEKQLQGIENDIKIHGGQDDIKRRKVIQELKIIQETSQPRFQEIKWELKNDGVVQFADLKLLDFTLNDTKLSSFTNPFSQSIDWNDGKINFWDFTRLDKRESVQFSFLQTGFQKSNNIQRAYRKNISTPRSFRYRNLGQPITLTIIECDGKGAYILTNTSNKDKIWNISLEFENVAEIPVLPNAYIHELSPQESFIKKYNYQKAGILIPKNFTASTKHAIGIIKKRSTERSNIYNCEIFVENRSEFLLHVIYFDVYPIDKITTPIFQLKSIYTEVIKPKLDFRQNFDIETTQDPPFLLLLPFTTLELMYDYDVDNRINVAELRETPEKEITGAAKKAIKAEAEIPPPIIPSQETISPELQAVEKEIISISAEIKDFESKLTILKARLEQKQQEKIQLQECIKKNDEFKKKQDMETKARQEAEAKARVIEEQKAAEEQKKLDALRTKIEAKVRTIEEQKAIHSKKIALEQKNAEDLKAAEELKKSEAMRLKNENKARAMEELKAIEERKAAELKKKLEKMRMEDEAKALAIEAQKAAQRQKNATQVTKIDTKHSETEAKALAMEEEKAHQVQKVAKVHKNTEEPSRAFNKTSTQIMDKKLEKINPSTNEKPKVKVNSSAKSTKLPLPQKSKANPAPIKKQPMEEVLPKVTPAKIPLPIPTPKISSPQKANDPTIPIQKSPPSQIVSPVKSVKESSSSKPKEKTKGSKPIPEITPDQVKNFLAFEPEPAPKTTNSKVTQQQLLPVKKSTEVKPSHDLSLKKTTKPKR